MPSTTNAVSSSTAYAGPPRAAAHRSAAASVLSGRSGWPRWGNTEKSTSPSGVASSPSGGSHPTNSSPMRGVSAMLPPLIPT
ncbi:Uncharacterised protein [Mycobacteroides abscessus]|nr:Uncharacterised protein [Mycobacteroides abscessus]